jgi:hypothetical protein
VRGVNDARSTPNIPEAIRYVPAPITPVAEPIRLRRKIGGIGTRRGAPGATAQEGAAEFLSEPVDVNQLKIRLQESHNASAWIIKSNSNVGKLPS